MTRVILDFPAPAAPPRRLVLDEPLRIITADTVAGIRHGLREAEAAARDGAWVAGCIAYEAAPAFDSALVTRPHAGPVPLLWFGVFGAAREEAGAGAAGAGARGAGGADGAGAGAGAVPQPAPLDWRTATRRGAYDAAIAWIREAIAAGDVYQVNHTLRFRARCDASPRALYDALVASRHGLYHALIDTPEWAVVSASPELFLDIRDGTVTTRPMKGTARRGRWLDEDEEAARRLAVSAKDRAENLMIVDLLRNDLGRVAQFGSVAVPRIFDIETYPTVHQMTSTVTARLRAGTSLDDVFAATFPCGSVTGAPKVTAMRAIAQLEDEPRGPYCGAVGVIRPGGSATFNVAIRTAVVDRRERTAVYGSGGGITWDSVADAEYDEVVAKAALLTEALPPFDLLETLRLDDGSYARLPRHLQRLGESARYWGFDADIAARAAEALDVLARALPRGSWRVRLTAARDGVVHTTHTALGGALGGAVGVRDDRREPLTVAVAGRAVSSRDRLLCHKTTARGAYDDARAEHPDAFDVLLHNEHGCITEFTIGNIVVEIGGALLTPARECGLLAGTLRGELLDAGVIREARLTLDDAWRARRLWFINGVRGWVPVRLVGGRGRGTGDGGTGGGERGEEKGRGS
jgi:para-aminobenzoate synthetase / 4-amino-4-deoxychorismate lyase